MGIMRASTRPQPGQCGHMVAPVSRVEVITRDERRGRVRCKRVTHWCWVLTIIAVLCGKASAGEVCRFVGHTDYAGNVAVTTVVTAAGDSIIINVAATFD